MLRSKLTPLVLLLAATALSAQETTGSALGRVTDKGGRPMRDILVRISSPGMLGERTALSDAFGQFRFPVLPNGKYSLTVSATGFVTFRAHFQVLAGQASHQDAILASQEETRKTREAIVEVVADSSQVDKTNTTTTTNFSMESLNMVESQYLDSIIQLAPGITGTLDPSVGGYSNDAVSIRGGIQHSSKVIQNGMNITEEGGGYLNETHSIMDMVDTMAVIQSPLNARYGNTDGGLISIVTTRGSNEFSGSVRLKYHRDDWTDNNPSYPRRDGSAGNPYYAMDDGQQRTWEISLKGPIWKDHITFAYGTQISPSSQYVSPVGGTTLNGLPSQAAYTWSPNAPGNGIIPANTYGLGNLDVLSDQSQFKQFVLFFQLTENHSLEYSYDSSGNEGYYGIPRFGRIDAVPGASPDNQFVHEWNLGYKGIFGTSGVLEARTGHVNRKWPHPNSPGQPPIWVTYVPASYDNAGNQPVSGLVDAYSTGVAQAYNINGYNADQGDTIYNDSVIVNFSQFISRSTGSHQLDVGFDQEKFQWDIQVGAAPDQYVVPGQDPATGNYLVYNAMSATMTDLDPSYTGTNTSVLANPMVNPGTGAPGSDNHWPGGLGLVPEWIHRSGDSTGAFRKQTVGYYLNDLWTIDNHHSVMAGVRYDTFKVFDDYGTMVSYGHLNPRFEYKFDIEGNQKRVINFSYGQFQASSPGSLFLPTAHGRLGDQTTSYWSAGSVTPYYTSAAQLKNPANYTQVSKTFAGQSFVVDPNWRNPVSSEFTLGYRRSLARGGFLRLTGIYKSWANLFDWYPGQAYTDPSGAANFQRVLRNDSSLGRTYKSLEAEWLAPITQRLSVLGNYTFARMMANTSATVDNPNRLTSQLPNWNNYFQSFSPGTAVQPYTQRTPDHTLNVFVTYDLASGKVKSSLTLRANYVSGLADATYTSYNPYSPVFNHVANFSVPYPTVPGYNDASNSNSGGLPNGYNLPLDGGRQINADTFTTSLKYNLDMPVYWRMHWFLNVDVLNVFNTKTQAPWSLPTGGYSDAAGQPPQYQAYGWRAVGDVSTVGTGRVNGRSISLDTGIKF